MFFFANLYNGSGEHPPAVYTKIKRESIMRRSVQLFFVLIISVLLHSQESELEKYKKMQQQDIDQWKQERDAELDAYKARVEKERKEWAEYVKGVRQKWGEFSDTTPKIWSNYGNDLNSLGRVDFDNNKVEIAALVEGDDPAAAEKLIEKQLEILLNEKEEGTDNKFMEGQIAFDKSDDENQKKLLEMEKKFEEQRAEIERKNMAQKEALLKRKRELETLAAEKKMAEEKKAFEMKKIEEEQAKIRKKEQEDRRKLAEEKEKQEKKIVKTVDSSNSKDFIKEKVKHQVKKEVVVGEDGKARTKYSVSLEMVPNSIQKRAENYIDLIKSYSEKNDVEAALVMALIHTESAFNPKAFSRRPDGTPMACGLMQIIPSQAGRDAHKALFGTDKIVESEYLFDPENNLRMGTWYVKWLSKWWTNYENKNFKRTSSKLKNEYYAISSYNQGMGTILNKAYKTHKLIDKSEQETYTILTTEKNVPKEGRDYLERVTKRKELYKSN